MRPTCVRRGKEARRPVKDTGAPFMRLKPPRHRRETWGSDHASMYAALYAELSGDQLRLYAHAAAEVQGLGIEDDWWPAVLRNLTVLLGQSDLVAVGPGGSTPAPPRPDTE